MTDVLRGWRDSNPFLRAVKDARIGASDGRADVVTVDEIVTKLMRHPKPEARTDALDQVLTALEAAAGQEDWYECADPIETSVTECLASLVKIDGRQLSTRLVLLEQEIAVAVEQPPLRPYDTGLEFLVPIEEIANRVARNLVEGEEPR